MTSKLNKHLTQIHMANSSTMQDFDRLYRLIEMKSQFIFNPRNPAVNRIAQRYDLSPAQIVILAYMLHYRDEIKGSRLTLLFKNYTENMDTAMDELLERRFVECVFEGNADLEWIYRVAPGAVRAFTFDEEYEPDLVEDCYAELSKCQQKDIYKRPWLSKFNKALRKEKDSRIAWASRELNIGELTESQQMAFWAYASYFVQHFMKPFRPDSDTVDADYEKSVSELTKKGLVAVSSNGEGNDNTSCDYFLSPMAAGMLFRGHEELINYDEMAKRATIIKNAELKKKELYYSAETGKDIDYLLTLLSEDGFKFAERVLTKQGRPIAIISLLWGPPGTGKTETVKQLALETGRDIILFDMSKVLGSLWGESEKGFRAVFRAYNYITRITDKMPILLLNEADTILSKRLKNVDRAIDKGENTLTNILLEEVENLRGILLATTNLIDNMDEAFYRRFLFKTKLEKPDAAARQRIWISCIPELTDAEANELANGFVMSGAQIDNVVAKRNLAELYYKGDRGLEYIKALCEEELSTENGSKSCRNRIGY